jgi:hypothetical protein
MKNSKLEKWKVTRMSIFDLEIETSDVREGPGRLNSSQQFVQAISHMTSFLWLAYCLLQKEMGKI